MECPSSRRPRLLRAGFSFYHCLTHRDHNFNIMQKIQKDIVIFDIIYIRIV